MSEVAIRDTVSDLVSVHEQTVQTMRELEPGMQLVVSSVDANQIMHDQAGYERSVCGAMLIYPEAMLDAWRAKVAKIQNPGTALFVYDRTRAFFRNAALLHTRKLHIDPVTMARELSQEDFAEMGGLMYVLQHTDFCFSLEASVSHLSRMIEAYRARQLQGLCHAAMDAATDTESLNSTITLLNEQATKLLTSSAELITPDEETCIDVIERLTTDRDSGQDIPTAFREFSNFVGDYKRGQITLIGAPPGNGKTAWAMQEIDCALKHGFVVDAFLMESSFDQFSERFLQRNYAIRGSKFRSKFFTKDEHGAIQSGMETLAAYKSRFHMAPMANYSVAEIDALIQTRKQATGLPCDLIVVDYLSTMSHPQEKGMSTYEAAKRTVHQLRSLAARENAAMLLLDQLSVEAIRTSFKGGSRLPNISAFRGGTPVESAKVVVILHKDEQDMLKNEVPVVEQKIVICKANDGQTGYVRSLFLKPFIMHVEDTSPQVRAQHAKWLNALNYDLNTPRKDVR